MEGFTYYYWNIRKEVWWGTRYESGSAAAPPTYAKNSITL